jgi:hypothetical protein
MKTILVLSPHPEIADSIRAGLNPTQYRIIHRTGEAEADPMLAHGLAQGVILDVEFNGVQNMWVWNGSAGGMRAAPSSFTPGPNSPSGKKRRICEA